MFRRPRQAPKSPEQPTITPAPTSIFDPWCGDQESPQLQAELLAGRWEPLRDALAAATPARRDFIIRKVTDQARPTPALDEWVRAEPKTSTPRLVRAVQRTNSAWAARGRRYASDVDARAWQGFQELLLDAEVDLHEAIRADATDALPWVQLMITGRTLSMTIEEACDRYETAERLAPGLPGAADQLLQCLSAKWLGDHSTMFAFAHHISDISPHGDVRHRLVAAAHLERGIAFGTDRSARDAFRRDPEVHGRITTAAQRSVFHADFGDGPEERITLSWFATAFGYFHLPEWSRPLFERIAAGPAPSGFEYFGDPAGAYKRYREAAGITG